MKLLGTLGRKTEEEITIRQLSIGSKIPYTTALRTINNNKKLFIIKKIGNIKICSLNLDEEIIKNYLIVSERLETEEFLNKNKEFKLLQEELEHGEYCLILFGSRAEEKHRKESDVDLCIINKTGNKNIKFSKFEMLFKLEVNPIYFSENEFKTMLNDKNHNVAKEILKKHIIIYNEDYFWNLSWGQIKNGIQQKNL